MVNNEILKSALDVMKDGLSGIEKLTADWKAIGLLSADGVITTQIIVDPSVPMEESLIDVKYSCGATARVQLNDLKAARLVPAVDTNKKHLH